MLLRLLRNTIVSLFLIISFAIPAHAYRILIDPGHGGRDLGAKQAPYNEADITWAWSLELKKLLSEKGFRVEMTRNETTGLSLHKRVSRLNQKKYDLVVSLHANYILDSRIKGTEYFIATPLDLEDQKLHLAHEEVQLKTGQKKTKYPLQNLNEEQKSQVSAIIRDLEKQSHVNTSLLLAERLNSNWKGRIKQGPFDLLNESDSPAILIELGYMSNPADLKNLLDAQFRLEKSVGMADVIASFFSPRKSEQIR